MDLLRILFAFVCVSLLIQVLTWSHRRDIARDVAEVGRPHILFFSCSLLFFYKTLLTPVGIDGAHRAKGSSAC